ncbi:ATP-dependent RNA helicase HrpA [Chitinispirillum alkaliphilum]|nr:ATP-dependent RNA helicase HrpA [Chitinispirillum alkaliphilum]
MISDIRNKKMINEKELATVVASAYDKTLPIFEHRHDIITTLKNEQVIIVSGQTGSGKTTQLPLLCLEAGRGRSGMIACTQPRRIAATSIADRVSSLLKSTPGSLCGYKIRFSEKSSPETLVKFMTDGMLLAEIENDPLLRRYDTIIIDEAHERSLNIDFLLGYLRTLLPKRPDLKLVISSATMDTSLFSRAFSDAPVEEVSGRLYPIELLYRLSEDDEEDSYTDEAVKTVVDLFEIQGADNTLIFMPAESDIRETCKKLSKKFSEKDTDIIPLFSKLSKKEQDRIFKSGSKIRIVVATNIAESSITVPGIRYVIDTGLARISRFAPRLRTNRLPIEKISMASADQRKGRCGRVKEGVCVRLYTEDDYLSREEFTTPEIKRSNLAGVILSMKAHNLGCIENFPFLEPPRKNAINDGYAQLKELGAIDSEDRLTSVGRQMARLPFDPHISRMILAARRENALREVKIIAAALSIVDPRERPFEQRNKADLVHESFSDTASDYLTYLNIWNKYHQHWQELKTQNKMRKFCKEHFLSYVRMREWNDVYSQLNNTIKNMPGFKENTTPASYDSVHRSLLTGLLSNVAYKDEKGIYRGAHGKEVAIFPGSALAGRKPKWIMCHEVVETSRPFARTVASIKPQWLEQTGANLCKKSYDNPFFDPENGTVKVTEKISLFGMPLGISRKVRYGKVNPTHAAEIFIHNGLIEEQLRTHHRFYKHNRKVKKDILSVEERLRTRTIYAGDTELYRFYEQRIPLVSSIHDLNAVIKRKGDKFLHIEKSALMVTEIPQQISYFPARATIGEMAFPLSYSFSPGDHSDGVTLHLPLSAVPYIQPNTLDWIVPGQWASRVRDLLASLPRSIRKQLIPLNEKAEKIASSLKPSQQSFSSAVARALKEIYKIDIGPDHFDTGKISPHLIPRVEVRGSDGKVLCSGRGGEKLQKISLNSENDNDSSPLEEKFKSFYRDNINEWPESENLKEPVTIGSDQGGVALRGFPALREKGDCVELILCKTQEESDRIHRDGCKKLLELLSVKDLSWAERDLSFSKELKLMCTPYGGNETLKKQLYNMLREYALDHANTLPRTSEEFSKVLNLTRESLKGTAFRSLGLLEQILRLLIENSEKIKNRKMKISDDIRAELHNDLNCYIKKLSSGKLEYKQFVQYPRYLSSFRSRIDKASHDPLKYRRLRGELAGFEARYKKIKEEKSDWRKEKNIEKLSAMLEEYAISLFSQQIKTLFPVSPKRIQKLLDEI